MDITFFCQSCGTKLVVDESHGGQEVDCPSCNSASIVPRRVSPKKKTIQHNQNSVSQSPPSSSEITPITQQVSVLCPKCGASKDHLIKASAAYEQGTTVVSGSGRAIGGAVFSDGDGGVDFAPAFGKNSYTGVQQTDLASRLRPPEAFVENRMNFRFVVLAPCFLVGGLILAITAVTAAISIVSIIGGLIGFGIFAHLAVTDYFLTEDINRERRKNHLQREIKWQKLWYCRSCGETFYF